MNLYEIDNRISDCFDAETGEIFDGVLFEELVMERDKKIENACLYIKNLKAQADALKSEKDAFAKRQKTAENKMESIKKYIAGYLDGTPFESTKVKVSFRKSESLEISEGAKVPEEFMRYKDPEVNKTELKKAIQSGLKVEGVEIVTNNNIQIK